MLQRNLLFSCYLIGTGLMLCGPAQAADDAAAICNAAVSAYAAAAASGDPVKMAAVFAPDGELVSPYGFLVGHDALFKFYASFMKPGDKDVFTRRQRTHDRRRGAVQGRHHFQTGLGRNGVRRASGRGCSARWATSGRF